MDMTKKALIIGAGIIGTSTALELARRGWLVTVIEQHSGAAQGSTARTSSVIRCHYTRSEAIVLAHEGATLWDNWQAYLGLSSTRAAYHKTGVLFLMRQGEGGPPSESLGVKAEMDQHDLDNRMNMMQQAGVEAAFMNQKTLADFLPCFDFPEDDVVGIWEPNSGFVFPPVDSVLDLQQAAELAGVQFKFDTKVVNGASAWKGERRWIQSVTVHNDDGAQELQADVVVNCAGPASHHINLAMHCPLGIATAPQRQFICEATWVNPTSDVPAMADLAEGFYIRPHEEVFKVGAALAADHVNFSTDEAGLITEREKEKFEKRVLASLRKRAPDIEIADVQTKVAFYDWSVSDSYPILDGTDVGGYYVAIGSSGAWFKSGPVIGQVMAEMIHREGHGDTNRDFVLPFTKNTLNFGDFSVRKRLA
tara:strand:+ start:1592 stop:2854 length:1263 start_codon:yes stop_codon:yes gene_type:complete